MKESDYLKDMKKWAMTQSEIYKTQIRIFIAEGWEKQKAIDTVLAGSTIGAGYKAQIRYDLKGE